MTTLLTYPFVDFSVVNFIISLVSFPVFGKVLENLYGGLALAKYLVVCSTATGAWLVLLGMFEPLMVRDLAKWSLIPESAYFGFQPVLMACFVALKQAMPETEVSIFFLFRVKLKNLPLFAMGLTTLASLLMPSRGAVAMFFALPISWLYLRYVSTLYGQNGQAGDLRDAFSLASFFPPQAQAVVGPVSRWLDARRCWPAAGSRGGALPVSASGAEIDSRAAPALNTSLASRENRAIATELINSRLQSLDQSPAPDTTVSFADPAADFADLTPIKKLDFTEQ